MLEKKTFLLEGKCFECFSYYYDIMHCRAVVQGRDQESVSADLDTREHCAMNAWMSSLLRSRMKRTPFVNVSHLAFFYEVGKWHMCVCMKKWCMLACLNVVYCNTGDLFLHQSNKYISSVLCFITLLSVMKNVRSAAL